MFKLLLIPLVLSVGCTAGSSLPPLTPAHPASPEAAEAPLPAPSQTLALPEWPPAARPKQPVGEAMPDGHGARGGGHAHH